MPERLPVPNESINQSLNNLDKAVAEAEVSTNREEALEALVHEYNRVFDIEIDNADRTLACGTFIIEHTDGSYTEQPDFMVYGSFSGFEVHAIYGVPYLVACIIPEDTMFQPDEDDQEMTAKLLLSSNPVIGAHSLIFDVSVDALGPKITEWSSKIRDALLANENIFKALRADIRSLFSEYVSFLREDGSLSQLEAENIAMTEILKYDVEALQLALFVALNPADSHTMRITSKGSLVSKNSDNRYDTSIKLSRIAEQVEYIGVYEGVAMRTLYRKDSRGEVVSISPQPCIAMFDEMSENIVLVPFANIKNLHFGDSLSPEQLPPEQRVSAETLEELDILASEGTDYA